MPDKPFPQRKSPRLRGYDYAQSGGYFVTICTAGRAHLFGEIVAGEMVLSKVGEIAHQEMGKIPEYWSGWVDIDLYIVMPNHVHIIVVLVGTARMPSASASHPDMPAETEFLPSVSASHPDTQKRVPTLGNVIGNYKSGVTRSARRMGYTNNGHPIWQGRYHDHIVRNEKSLNKLREYVLDNPARWEEDVFYK